MAISISYVDMESKQVGTISSPAPERLAVDRVLRESHLSVEFGFTPPLSMVEGSIADYREEQHAGHPFVLHLWSRSPIAYRDATPIELELWSSFCWDEQPKFSEILDRQFSREMPAKLKLGEVRIDTFNTEIFTELWITLDESSATLADVEAMARAIDGEFGRIWQRVCEVSSDIEPPTVFIPGPRAPSVFICHSTLDKPFVRRLCEELKKKKIRVWLDEEQILVGHDFVARMEEGITASDFTAVILSPRFVAHGPWAKEEYRTALTRQVAAKRVVLLPVLLEPCDIPPLLTSKKYADFTDAFEDGFKSLAFSIANHKR